MYNPIRSQNSQLKGAINMMIKQSSMTAECWLIQFSGLTACKSCEAKDTEDCGGIEIRKTLKNSKGFPVPLS